MSNLKIRERRIGNVTVLDIDGNIRIDGSSVTLAKAIISLCAEGRNQVVLNLAQVAYIDSSGLGELISAQAALKNKRGGMKLLNLTKRLLEIMTITKLVTVFDIYEDESEAIGGFKIADTAAVPSVPLDETSLIAAT